MANLKELADALDIMAKRKAQGIQDDGDRLKAQGILDKILEERKKLPKNPLTNKELAIYVAGPYTPKSSLHDAARVVQENVERSIDAYMDVVERGHQAFLPHLSHFVHVFGRKTLSYKYYTESDIFWLNRCNALYFYNPRIGDSSGADNELKLSIEKGDKIFFSKDEIPVYKIGAERNSK